MSRNTLSTLQVSLLEVLFTAEFVQVSILSVTFSSSYRISCRCLPPVGRPSSFSLRPRLEAHGWRRDDFSAGVCPWESPRGIPLAHRGSFRQRKRCLVSGRGFRVGWNQALSWTFESDVGGGWRAHRWTNSKLYSPSQRHAWSALELEKKNYKKWYTLLQKTFTLLPGEVLHFLSSSTRRMSKVGGRRAKPRRCTKPPAPAIWHHGEQPWIVNYSSERSIYVFFHAGPETEESSSLWMCEESPMVDRKWSPWRSGCLICVDCGRPPVCATPRAASAEALEVRRYHHDDDSIHTLIAHPTSATTDKDHDMKSQCVNACKHQLDGQDVRQGSKKEESAGVFRGCVWCAAQCSFWPPTPSRLPIIVMINSLFLQPDR